MFFAVFRQPKFGNLILINEILNYYSCPKSQYLWDGDERELEIRLGHSISEIDVTIYGKRASFNPQDVA